VACSCHQFLLQIQRSYRFSCHERAPRRMDVTMSRHVVEKADGRARLIRATTGNGPRPCGCPIRRLNLTMKEHVQRRTLLNEGNNAPARARARALRAGLLGAYAIADHRRVSPRAPACPTKVSCGPATGRARSLFRKGSHRAASSRNRKIDSPLKRALRKNHRRRETILELARSRSIIPRKYNYGDN